MAESQSEPYKVSPELLAVLVCPRTKAKLVQAGDWLYSTDPQHRVKYPITGGIPQLLMEEAVEVGEEEHRRVVWPVTESSKDNAMTKVE